VVSRRENNRIRDEEDKGRNIASLKLSTLNAIYRAPISKYVINVSRARVIERFDTRKPIEFDSSGSVYIYNNNTVGVLKGLEYDLATPNNFGRPPLNGIRAISFVFPSRPVMAGRLGRVVWLNRMAEINRRRRSRPEDDYRYGRKAKSSDGFTISRVSKRIYIIII